jgi:hypothetical protein
MSEYVLVVEFLSTPNGRVFYMAHIFCVSCQLGEQPTQTFQASVTADTPEQAIYEGEFLLWLLDLDNQNLQPYNLTGNKHNSLTGI